MMMTMDDGKKKKNKVQDALMELRKRIRWLFVSVSQFASHPLASQIKGFSVFPLFRNIETNCRRSSRYDWFSAIQINYINMYTHDCKQCS